VVNLEEARVEAQASHEEGAVPPEGEGTGRRRRRRGGRGRGERGEGGERVTREAAGDASVNGQLFETPTQPSETTAMEVNLAEPATMREERPHRERPSGQQTLAEQPQTAHDEEKAMPASAPAVPPAPPTAFHAVIQHDDVETEAHKPVRKRRRHGEETQASEPAPLQMVETQVETPPPAGEDELPRRTKPRRRRGGEQDSGPLMMVETQQGNTPPTP
jgi:ribonuclease E